ncbi:unnamed protein product [Tuber aestivum]|uniref:Uncharacterized protein n=1 Tax=Tuber aestivum TaxID=59557 RepID=A0A292Q6U1_9PEZI|nr:unnamed protein product [Tuber aestivum]
MQRYVSHLIAIGAFTRQSLPVPMPRGTSLEFVVQELLEKWGEKRAGYLNIQSPILFETLLERSRQPKGIFPLITEQPAAVHPSPSAPPLLELYKFAIPEVFRIPPRLLATLNDTSKGLDFRGPRPTGGGRDPLARGRYMGRHYAVWADYNKKRRGEGHLGSMARCVLESRVKLGWEPFSLGLDGRQEAI